MPASFQYLPLAKIASGGTATVYIGARRPARELVALKRPHPHVLEDSRQRAEVLREAHVAASLHHPNIVGVRAVESQGDEIQLVMDYVEGAALGSLIAFEARRDARLPVGVALRILLDACEGLAAVHAQTDAEGQLLGLVHRDVSPQNILVGIDGRSRLTDFGLAKAVYTGAPSTTQGTLKGKLGYMAPEYVHRGHVDRSVDVFAMGVVLWEALAGRRLFRGENEAQTLDRVLRESPARLADIAPELAPFDDVVARATRKQPEERLASAMELRAALADAAAQARLSAREEDVAAYVQGVVGQELAVRRAEVQAALRARGRPVRIGATATAAAMVATGAVIALRGGSVAPATATATATTSASASATTTTPATTTDDADQRPRTATDGVPPGRSPWRTTERGEVPPTTATSASATATMPTTTPTNPPPRSRSPRPPVSSTPALPPNPYDRAAH